MKHTLKYLALALLVGLAMTSCKKEYTITVASNNTDWGTTEGSGVYVEGKTVKISAYPKSGYYFIKWNDNVTDNPRTIEVTGDATYTAYFSNDPNGGDNPGGGGDNDPLTMSGTISSNVTWADRGLPVDYIIDGRLDIDGNALLTIDPGVTIMFTGTNGGIYVGENAGLKMVGTASNPIVLCGPTNNPNNGSWDRIEIISKRNDNQFEYVQFLRGGSNDNMWFGVVSVSGKLSMKHCTIDGSLNSGLSIGAGATLTAFEGNTIKNCAQYPVFTERLDKFCTVSTDNTYTSNTHNMIYVDWGMFEDENSNINVQAMSIPYYLVDGFDFTDSRTVTISAGVSFVVANNFAINVSDETTFKAQGTASNPVVFKGLGSTPSWRGILMNSTQSGSEMLYCQIQNAGNGNEWDQKQCLRIAGDAMLTLTGCTFGPSGHYGVIIENIENWGNITHSGCTFTGCADGNVLIENWGEYNGTEYNEGDVLNALP